MEYHCDRSPWICSVCHSHNLFLPSSLMTYHQILKRIRWQVPLVWAGTAYSSGVLEFSHGFGGVHVAQFLVFCVVFCRSLFFCPYSFYHCLSSYIISDYSVGIFKLFFLNVLVFKSFSTLIITYAKGDK